jgi:phosphatidylethanolamine/phosphatidyl-N-methylethanolamine N-methyltransferase
MVCPELKLIDRKALRPWGIFTMMRFRKDESTATQRPEAAE